MDDSRKNKTVVFISIFTIIVGFVVIMGWVLNVSILEQLLPFFIPMKFNTAVCFILIACALLITQYQPKRFSNLFFVLCAGMVTLIGTVTLLQNLFSVNIGLDELFIIDKAENSVTYPYPGRMAFNTSAEFGIFGLGLLLLAVKKDLFNKISQYLFHTVTILSAITLIGYLYGVSIFMSVFYVSSMATHVAVLFFILSIVASLLHPNIGLTSLFTGKQIGNQMAKRLFSLMLLMVVAFGAVLIQSQRFDLFSLDTWISLLAVCFLLVSLMLIHSTAKWLNKIDIQRSVAEADVKLMNADLELRVEERSAEILKSEEKYRSLIEQASDAIYVLNFDMNFIDVNDSMCKMMGYSREELLHMNVEAIIDPKELEVDPLSKSPLIPGHSIVRERRFKRKDGAVLTVEINVKRFADNMILVVTRDVTDRKRIETELREAELKFRTIAEKSIIGVYIVQNGKFVYVNPRFAEVFGYKPEELMNTVPLETIIDEGYKEKTTEYVRQRMSGEVESVHYETRGRMKDGSSNWVEFYGTRTEMGGLPTIIGSMLDITERKKAEEIVKRSEANLKTILSTTDTAYALIDTNFNVLEFNEKAFQFVLEQYHHIPEKGDKLGDYFPPDRFPQFVDYAKQVITGKHISYEIDYPQPDGTVIWYNVRLSPITNDHREILGMLMALYDVTERKTSEQNLQSAYERIQDHINSIKDMAWKQSHLIRSPLANLKALAMMLKEHPNDKKVLDHLLSEVDRLDTIIHEMAQDASEHGI